MTKQYQIPFDQCGNQLHYPGFHSEWKDNFVFNGKLLFRTYQRGRSAAYFEFLNLTTDTEVTCFLTDFCDMIPLMKDGIIEGSFTFVKRGQNYGVKLVV